MAIPATARFRVIHHLPICPRCGSSNITTDDIETTDGFTEEAFICLVCGEAWPLACVTDWDTPTHTAPAPNGIAPALEGGQ
jgi:hypothetical protein